MSNMNTGRRTKHQILRTIIERIMIDVVNNFFWPKKATEFLFHNQTMFGHIAIFGSVGMVGLQKISVATQYKNAALPFGIQFASSFVTFMRAIFLFFLCTAKRFFAGFTNVAILSEFCSLHSGDELLFLRHTIENNTIYKRYTTNEFWYCKGKNHGK